MLYQSAEAVKKLMMKFDTLKDEYVEVEKISLDDHDLEGLRKKAGDRVITLSKEILKNSVKEDMYALEKELNDYICARKDFVEEIISIALSRMVDYILKKYSLAGSFHDLSKEQRENCKAEQERLMRNAIQRLTGIVERQNQ